VIWLITSKLGRMLSAIGFAVVAVLAVFTAGARSNKKAAEVKYLKGYIKTQERVNEVDVSADRDDAIKRLRNNDQIRD
jgi:hypothetical protein